MTRPSEVKPREDEQPGTPWEDFKVGDNLPELRFTVTPEIVREYQTAIDARADGYQHNGQNVAGTNVLAVYLLATLYRKYPPIQGIILTHQSWQWHSTIPAEAATEIVAVGRIEDAYERRGKHYLHWSAEFHSVDGTPIATAENRMYLPS